MSNLSKVLYQGQPGTGPTTLYTVPASKHAYVKGITVVNADGAAGHTIKLWVGGSADTNIILPQRSLGGGESLEGDGLLTLDTGKTIVGQADASAKVTVTIYGLELDGAGPA